jgi:hypothetical protein
LKKPTQEPLRLFHSYAQARRRLIYKPIFKRQRSTLIMLFFGPKNGEHLTDPSRVGELLCDRSRVGVAFIRHWLRKRFEGV